MRQFIEEKSDELNWYFESFYYQDYMYHVTAHDLIRNDMFYMYDSFSNNLKSLLENGMDNLISEAFGRDVDYYLIKTPDDEIYLVIPSNIQTEGQAIEFAEKLNRVMQANYGESLQVEVKQVRYDCEWEYRGHYDLRVMYPYYKYYFEFKPVDDD